MTPMYAAATWIDVLALALCVAFLGYVATILVPFLRQEPAPTGDPDGFEWHALVPCLDEAVVIERTVRRLRASFPQMHVWCVDDASADGTLRILRALAAEDDHVHVVRREFPQAQQGKGAALNAGWRAIREHVRAASGSSYEEHSHRVVVGVLDADGRLDPMAPEVISGPGGFGDEEVGAVQVQVRMINRGLEGRVDAGDPAPRGRLARTLVVLQDLEFRVVIAAMQGLRRNIGSVGMGGNGQFTRLRVLDAIAEEHGTPWHGALLEDFELGLHVLLAGWRNQYLDSTWVAQEGLPSPRLLVRQRTRWAQGGMQCLKYLPTVLASRRLSTPAALEICYFLLIPWTQLLGSVVFLGAGAVMATYAVQTPGGIGAWLAGGAWGLIPLVLIFGIGPLALWGPVYRLKSERSLSRWQAVRLGLAYWLYTYLMIAAVWNAATRIARARHDWVKTQRVLQRTPETTRAPV